MNNGVEFEYKSRISELEGVVRLLRDALVWLMKVSINLVKSKPVRSFEETVSEAERAIEAASKVLGETK